MAKKKMFLLISLLCAFIFSTYGSNDNTVLERFCALRNVSLPATQTCECTQVDQDKEIIKNSSITISFQKNLSDASKKAKKKKVRYVYITETGSKYHTSTCRYLWNSCYKIKLSKAKKSGYTACSVCNP